MKILIIEDDIYKIEDITKFLNENLSQFNLTTVNSSTSGINKLKENSYDLILLDMSLPLYDLNYSDDDFDTFAGIDILDEMYRLEIFTKVIVITAFDVLGDNEITLSQLNKQMNEDFNDFYLGIIHYQKSSLDWTGKLKNYLSGVNDI